MWERYIFKHSSFNEIVKEILTAAEKNQNILSPGEQIQMSNT